MKILLKQFVLVIAVLTSEVLFAQDKQDSNFEIYILMGQSNMAGRGPIISNKTYHSDSVYVLNKDKRWVRAMHPLHFDKPSVAGVGPGLAFGVKMAKAHKGAMIGLVPCAVGGTKIEYWTPGGFDPVTKTHPFDDAVLRIKEAMRHGVIKGVIWHQGEANSNPEQVTIYLDQLAELVGRVREMVGDSQLPFIVGELGQFYANSIHFNPQINLVSQKVPFTAVVSSKGLMHKGDTLHFDGSSADKLGERYAEKMLKVQKQVTTNMKAP